VPYDPDRHHRRSIRLQGYDYRLAGAYFVTLCSQDRACLFGDLKDGQMHLSDIGRIVQEEWLRAEIVRAHVELDAFVVMPNHLHGIIVLSGDVEDRLPTPIPRPDLIVPVGATQPRATQPRATQRVAPTGPRSGSLGAIIGQFKAVTTKRARALGGEAVGSLWQRNYYERIIRNEAELDRIRHYIEQNPINWARDAENPAAPRPTGPGLR
jgi:putative transposase